MWNLQVTHKTIWTGIMLFVSITLLLPAATDDSSGQTTRAKQSRQQKQMGMHNQTASQGGILCSVNDLMGSDVRGTGSPTGRSYELGENPNEKRMSDQAFDRNQKNELIGTVEEVVIDDNNDEICYIVLQSDNKYYAVPWRAFEVRKNGFTTEDRLPAGNVRTRRINESQGTVDQPKSWGNQNQSTAEQLESWANQDKKTRSGQKPKLYLNLTKEQLLQAPTLSTVSVEDLSDSQLKQTVNTFYSQYISRPDSSRQGQKRLQERSSQSQTQTTGQGRTPEQSQWQAETGRWQTTDSHLTAANVLKASEVIGLDLQSSTDVDLGSVEDLVIDTREGQIAYGLVSFGGFLGIGEEIAAVPWTALTVQMPQGHARIQATQDQLDAGVLDKGSIEKLSEQQFAQNIHSRFSVEPYWGIYGYVPAGPEESESTETNGQQELNERQKEREGRQQQDQQPSDYNQDPEQSQP